MSSSSPAAGASSSSQAQKRPREDAGNEDDDEAKRRPSAQRAATASRVQLHRHALESIFACLDIAGLATVLRVSHEWQAAVGSMRSINCCVQVASNSMLQQVVYSRMRHHVTDVSFAHEYSLTTETLTLLHLRMPHLQRISSVNLTVASGVSTVMWPSQLQVLHLGAARLSVAEANMLLRSISGLLQLRELSLCLQHHAFLSFTPLASLPLLRSFTLNWVALGSAHLSDTQIDELRALVDLEKFDVSMAAANIPRLLRPPHALRWPRLPSYIYRVDDAVGAILPALRYLTTLNISGATCSHFDWLPRMQSLTQLYVGLSDDHPSSDAATQSLVDALRQCPRITSLSLTGLHMPITSDQLAACLPGMPALSSLQVWEARLPSLSFLALPSLAASLQELSLNWPQEPKPAISELHHLHGLISLRDLTLDHALAAPLDAETQSLYQPPSLLMPSLRRFCCE